MKRFLLISLAIVAIPLIAYAAYPPGSSANATGGWAYGTNQYSIVGMESDHSMDVHCDNCSSGGGGGATTNPITSAQQTATSTATALPSATFTNGFVVTANSANIGLVCIGGSSVTTTSGYCLKPGYSISYGAANSNMAYIVDSTAGDTVQVTGN